MSEPSHDIKSQVRAVKTVIGKQASRVFNERQLFDIFHQNSKRWKSLSQLWPSRFVDIALTVGVLSAVTLKSEYYKSKTRYIKKGATKFEIALSLAKNSYLSHASAVFLYGLNEQIPRTIYVNREQSPKPKPDGELTQERIDRAFSGRQRTSKYVFNYESHRIVLLNGKSTGKYGVISTHGPEHEQLEATSIERTLVDIVVRPAYSGGIVQVLEAFRGAKRSISGEQLLLTLKKLSYSYPYHQSIGYLLERAGYDSRDIEPFRKVSQDLNFYLIHAMKETELVPQWRLYIPKGF